MASVIITNQHGVDTPLLTTRSADRRALDKWLSRNDTTRYSAPDQPVRYVAAGATHSAAWHAVIGR